MNWRENQGKRSIGSEVINLSKSTEPNKKEVQFYFNLIEFLKEKGFNTTCFERSKTRQTIWSRINGMKTVLRKNGLAEEFFNRYYGGKDE